MKAPGMSEEEILKKFAADPNLGDPFPADGRIQIENLQAKTPYKLAFIAEGDPAADEKPDVVGYYSFTSGPLARPSVPKWLGDLLDGGEEPVPQPDPEPGLPTDPTEETAEETTEPTETTVETTEETTEETTVPTEPWFPLWSLLLSLL